MTKTYVAMQTQNCLDEGLYVEEFCYVIPYEKLKEEIAKAKAAMLAAKKYAQVTSMHFGTTVDIHCGDLPDLKSGFLFDAPDDWEPQSELNKIEDQKSNVGIEDHDLVISIWSSGPTFMFKTTLDYLEGQPVFSQTFTSDEIDGLVLVTD